MAHFVGSFSFLISSMFQFLSLSLSQTNEPDRSTLWSIDCQPLSLSLSRFQVVRRRWLIDGRLLFSFLFFLDFFLLFRLLIEFQIGVSLQSKRCSMMALRRSLVPSEKKPSIIKPNPIGSRRSRLFQTLPHCSRRLRNQETGLLLGFTGFYWVLPSLIELEKVSLDVTWFYWVFT